MGAGGGGIAVTHEVTFSGVGRRLLAARPGPRFRRALPPASSGSPPSARAWRHCRHGRLHPLRSRLGPLLARPRRRPRFGTPDGRRGREGLAPRVRGGPPRSGTAPSSPTGGGPTGSPSRRGSSSTPTGRSSLTQARRPLSKRRGTLPATRPRGSSTSGSSASTCRAASARRSARTGRRPRRFRGRSSRTSTRTTSAGWRTSRGHRLWLPRRGRPAAPGCGPLPLASGIRPVPVEYADGTAGAFAESHALTADAAVRLVPTLCHTRGHLSVLEGPVGSVLLAGDASFSLDQARRRAVAGVCEDWRRPGGRWTPSLSTWRGPGRVTPRRTGPTRRSPGEGASPGHQFATKAPGRRRGRSGRPSSGRVQAHTTLVSPSAKTLF